MSLHKKEHWFTREYIPYINANEKTPFQWGVCDCALFAANGILAITGVDIAEDFRNTYKTEIGAIRSMKKITGLTNPTVEDAAIYCANKYGITECKTPLYAQCGDLVVIENEGNVIAGLVHPDGLDVIAAGEDGWKAFPLAQIKRAWHIESHQ
jgi:hypothetical protein